MDNHYYISYYFGATFDNIEMMVNMLLECLIIKELDNYINDC